MSLYLWLSVMVKAGVIQCGDDWHIKDRRFSRELSKDVCICLLVTGLKKQTHWTQQLNEFLWNTLWYMFGRRPASYTMWLAYIHTSGHINRWQNSQCKCDSAALWPRGVWAQLFIFAKWWTVNNELWKRTVYQQNLLKKQKLLPHC